MTIPDGIVYSNECGVAVHPGEGSLMILTARRVFLPALKTDAVKLDGLPQERKWIPMTHTRQPARSAG